MIYVVSSHTRLVAALSTFNPASVAARAGLLKGTQRRLQQWNWATHEGTAVRGEPSISRAWKERGEKPGRPQGTSQ